MFIIIYQGIKSGNDMIDKCTIGEYYSSKTKLCDSCPEGKYSLTLNASDCKECPGEYASCL